MILTMAYNNNKINVVMFYNKNKPGSYGNYKEFS